MTQLPHEVYKCVLAFLAAHQTGEITLHVDRGKIREIRLLTEGEVKRGERTGDVRRYDAVEYRVDALGRKPEPRDCVPTVYMNGS